MVPDVRKRLEVPQMQILRCLGRPCDHAALMAVFMAMGRLMGFVADFPHFSRSSGLSRIERQCQFVFDFQPVSCACG